MASKLGTMLSMILIYIAFLFGVDFVSIQLTYSCMDSLATSVSFKISKSGIIDDDVKKYFDVIKEFPLSELCYLSEIIKKTYLPRASADGNKERADILMAMYSVLDGVIIQKLDKKVTYTLLDGEEMFVNHNQAAYLLYTNRFQYMGEYRYKEISLEGFVRQLEAADVNYAIVTSGPGSMHLTSTAAMRQTLDKMLH